MPPIVFGTRFGTPKVIEIGPKCSQNGPNGTPRESLKIFIFFNGSERGKRAEKEPKRSTGLREAQGDLSTRGGTLCNGPLKQGRSGGDGGIIGAGTAGGRFPFFSFFLCFFLIGFWEVFGGVLVLKMVTEINQNREKS